MQDVCLSVRHVGRHERQVGGPETPWGPVGQPQPRAAQGPPPSTRPGVGLWLQHPAEEELNLLSCGARAESSRLSLSDLCLQNRHNTVVSYPLQAF